MSRSERVRQILDRVVAEGACTVEDVMQTFGVSAATARRDLDLLSEQQLVTRTHGGARANRSTGEVPMRYRAAGRRREKLAIARATVGLIEEGEVVAFNGGTTTTTVAWELGIQLAERHPHDEDVLTVVTNAINIANDLAVRDQMRVVVTGGVARARSYELVGPLAEALLPRISIDTLVLGVSALEPGGGLFTHHDGEASVNAALVTAARRTIVVADSSKIGMHAFARICGLDEVDLLVTDADITAEQRRGIESAQVDVVVASPSE